MELMQFEKEYRVHVYETGPEGTLSIYSLFNYLQDIASDHAIRLGFGTDDLMKENRFWVLSRIYAELSAMPGRDDSIIVRTWPNGTDKLFALRNFEVFFPDGRHIANATSSWLILDRTTKRIQRPDTLLSRFYPDLNSAGSLIRNSCRLDFPDAEFDFSQPFSIKPSDLDINLHTNNVRYLTWVIDSYNLDFIMKNLPESVEINYLAESQNGEEVVIKSLAEEPGKKAFNHSILRVSDKRELCRIRIEWKSRESE